VSEEIPESAEEGGDEDEAESGPKTSIIAPAINSVILLGALGFLAYTRLIYRHPVITDAAEKARILAIKTEPQSPTEGKATVAFGPLTVNILASPDNTDAISPSSPQVKGKMHFLSTEFTLEIRDSSQVQLVQSLKPFILDKLIQIVGKKNFHELATVQGRYILHSQLVDMANQTISSRVHSDSKEQLVTNLYFTTFLVQ
jgi:flagellar basal body-associated protein FliL